MPIFFDISQEGKNIFATPTGEKTFLVGRRVRYTANDMTRYGLANDGSPTAKACLYDPADYRDQYGFWADFIYPTALAESGASFTVVNTYDRAAFTFGVSQFAAHTPDENFVVLFRNLLQRAEAHDYFPGLAVRNGRITDIETGQRLENEESTAGLKAYLNENPDDLDSRETVAAAKLIHWTMTWEPARALQVLMTIARARKKISTPKLDLDGRTAAECCVVYDLLHHGRGGSNAYTRIRQALDGASPLGGLLSIGAAAYPQRLETLTAAIGKNGQFQSLHWSTATGEFV